MAALSFLLGAVYLVLGLVTETRVEGWTTLVVLLAVFNGFTIGLLSMLGEYVVRTLNAVSAPDTYHVAAPGHPVTDHLAGHRRAALRHDVPAHAARRAPRHRDGRARAAGAQGVPADEVVRRGHAWYDAAWFPDAPPGALLGEKCTSYLEVPATIGRVRAVLGDPWSWCSCATRSPGRCRTGS